MRPLQISPETAIKLSQMLKVPVEHLMHMPQHILMQKLAELTKLQQQEAEAADTASPASDKRDVPPE